jgi:signal transduction histidine kinase
MAAARGATADWGLGLAIVRHLVELHGGTVHADSAGESHGATFTVRLPLMAVQPAEDDAPNSGDGAAEQTRPVFFG